MNCENADSDSSCMCSVLCVLSTLFELTHLFLTIMLLGTIISSILEMRKLRHTEVK